MFHKPVKFFRDSVSSVPGALPAMDEWNWTVPSVSTSIRNKMETSHFEARSHQSSALDDLLDELDTLDADWCDHPSFFNMLQSPHSSPRAESASWEFVMEKPQVDPRYEPMKKENLPEMNLSKACPRGGACTRCHASKVALSYVCNKE